MAAKGERGRGEGMGRATSNSSGVSQALSPGDVERKTLMRVEVSRPRLATASHWLQESQWCHSKTPEPTRQEGRIWKETKA